MTCLAVDALPLSDQIAIELREAGKTAARYRELMTTLELGTQKRVPPLDREAAGRPSTVLSSNPLPVAEIHNMDARRSEVQPATRSDWKALAITAGAVDALVLFFALIGMAVGGHA